MAKLNQRGSRFTEFEMYLHTRTLRGYLETNFPAQKRQEDELNARHGENGATSFTVFPASTRISGRPQLRIFIPINSAVRISGIV